MKAPAYRIDETPTPLDRSGFRFVIWRNAGGTETTVMRVGSTVRPLTLKTRKEAESEIVRQRRADRAAATRLGVELTDED